MALHGGDIYTACNLTGNSDIIDFSANISPFGVPESVRKAITDNIDNIINYPDPCCRKLREELSRFHNIMPNQIVCGNGGADIIFRLIDVIRPKNTLIPVPAFSEYTEAIQKHGLSVKKLCLESPFIITDSIIKELKTGNYDFLVLCNPNNPTGSLIPPPVLNEITEYAKNKNIRILLDECFFDMVNNKNNNSLISKINYYPNLFILKSMTKMYAIAGLRIGYGISSDISLIERISESGQPWAVNTLAEAAGCAALNDSYYRERFLDYLYSERIYLYEELKKIGFQVWIPNANFVFFHASGFKNLDEILLFKYNILIRHCDNYDGLDSEYYRVAVRKHSENNYLLECLKTIIS